MTERLSDERLDELAPLLSCTRSGQVLDQDEQCSCVDCSWDAGIAESCLALLDEVRERRAAPHVPTCPAHFDPGCEDCAHEARRAWLLAKVEGMRDA